MLVKSYGILQVIVDGTTIKVYNRVTEVVYFTKDLLDLFEDNILGMVCTKDYLIIGGIEQICCIEFKTGKIYGVISYIENLDFRAEMSIDKETLVCPRDNYTNDIYALPKLEYVITTNISEDFNNDRLDSKFGITRNVGEFVSYNNIKPNLCDVILSKIASRRVCNANWYVFLNDYNINLLMIYKDTVELLVYNRAKHTYSLVTEDNIIKEVNKYDVTHTYNGITFVVVDGVPQTAYLTEEGVS